MHSERSPAFCVRNFSDGCQGKQDEFGDITANRADFVNNPLQSTFFISSISYNTAGNVPAGADARDRPGPVRFRVPAAFDR